MCYFYRTYCLNCDKLYKKCIYEECDNKKRCRKELFEFEPGYFYYEICPDCEKSNPKIFWRDGSEPKPFYVPF